MNSYKILHKLALYLILMRLHKPTGIWLLMWPCWWGIALAAQNPFHELYLLGLFFLGAIIMRSAGCVINDIIDREIDAKVERTRNRPLASGQLSTENAMWLLAILLSIGLMIVTQLNWFTISLGLLFFIMVVAYPYMKRLIKWPQVFLGLTFNAGAILGWSAVTGQISYAALLLYLGCVFWTIGYDTIYAHQDREYDLELGINSTAVSLADKSRMFVTLSYLAMILCFFAVGTLSFREHNMVYFSSLVIATTHLLWQARRVNFKSPADCMKKFRSNGWFGWVIFLGIVIEKIIG